MPDEKQLWWYRGYYLGKLIQAVETFLADVSPTPAQGAALSMMFRRETGREVKSEEDVAAWEAWRTERVERGGRELLVLMAEIEERCNPPKKGVDDGGNGEG